MGKKRTEGRQMKEDLALIRLWDVYSPMLTERQRTIGELYFDYDLSLGEIAEQTSVSRQSVYDCLQTTKNILLTTEEKLGFVAAQDRQREALEKYFAAEESFLGEVFAEGADEVREKLVKLRVENGVES